MLGIPPRALAIGLVLLSSACAPDDVFELRVAECESSMATPDGYGVFYSIDDGQTQCFSGACNQASQSGCLSGVETPDFPADSNLEIQVVLYKQGFDAIACSAPLSVRAHGDTEVTLALQCDAPSLGSCPVPPSDCEQRGTL